MAPGTYRLVVLGSALSWLLLGLHLPAVHQVTDHGATLHWSVTVAILLLAVAGVAAVLALLRAPRGWREGGGPESA